MVEITLGVCLFFSLLEFLHWKRCRKISQLIQQQQPRPWTGARFFLRIVAATLFTYAFTQVIQSYQTPSSDELRNNDKENKQELLILLDVSKSMYIQDAGRGKKITRKERALEVFRSILPRIQVDKYNFSLYAFYTDLKPVIDRTYDTHVIENTMLVNMFQVFDNGKTNIELALGKSFDLIKDRKDDSVTVILITDGDLEGKTLPAKPSSVRDMVVIGIGSSSGQQIHGHTSRQDSRNLNKIAAHYNGSYSNSNEQMIMSNALGGLIPSQQRGEIKIDAKTHYLALMCLACLILCLFETLLKFYGNRRRTRISRS